MKFSKHEDLLCYPEETPREIDAFFDRIINLLTPCLWVAIDFLPAPWSVRERIEADCCHVLTRIEVPPYGIYWLCPLADLKVAMPGLFTAFVPEMAFVGFDFKPKVNHIRAAVEAEDAKPAKVILFFDSGMLWEMRDVDGSISL